MFCYNEQLVHLVGITHSHILFICQHLKWRDKTYNGLQLNNSLQKGSVSSLKQKTYVQLTSRSQLHCTFSTGCNKLSLPLTLIPEMSQNWAGKL